MAPGNQQLKRTFGQSYRKRGSSRYQRQHGSSSSTNHSRRERELTEEQERAQRRLALKLKRRNEDEIFDANNGFERFCFANSFAEKKGVSEEQAKKEKVNSGRIRERRGWIFNMLPTVSEI